MYATPTSPNPLRHVDYGRRSYRRPPRQVPAWRRAVRNVLLGIAVLGLLIGVFTVHAMGAERPGARTVVVQPGQTLWQIAETRYPNQNPQEVVQEIDQANHLTSGVLYPGQHLLLPAA